MDAIRKLCGLGIPPGLIITLHRCNASPERLPKLLSWIRELETVGVRSVSLHLLESETQDIRNKYGLSPAENTAALTGFLEIARELTKLKIAMFDEMQRLLVGDDRTTTCVWYGCDSYTTSAVRGVEGKGQRSNCGRTNKDGVDFIKAAAPGYERYLALYQTPQEDGGCRDCRFFLMCKGQCPGTAIDGDWRNRSEHCETWMNLFERMEKDLVAKGVEPLSLSPSRGQLEAEALAAWSSSQQVSMTTILRQTSQARKLTEGIKNETL